MVWELGLGCLWRELGDQYPSVGCWERTYREAGVSG